MSQYNLRNPAVKRLMREAEELKSATEEYYAQPLEDNLFEWHFTLRGPPNTEFEGGIYHGRITLPHDYPMKPPSIILLTPNGRFEINKKICLSISGHHPETWQPSWSIRTALLAIIGFLPTHGNGAIGSLDYTPEERKSLALKSQDWKCSECGHIKGCLKSPEAGSSEKQDTLIEENVSLSPADENIAAKKTDIPYNKDLDSSKISEIENFNTNTLDKHCREENFNTNTLDEHCREENFNTNTLDEHCREENFNTNTLDEHCRETPNDISETDFAASEYSPIVRQRNVVSCRLAAESVQSDSVRSVQPAKDRSTHNYGSLVMIWVISVILFILIIRRWLSYDYTL